MTHTPPVAGSTDWDVTLNQALADIDNSHVPKTLVDAKGDLIVATAADAVSRIAVGTSGQVLTPDSGQSTGLKWGTPVTAGTAAVATSQGTASNTFTDLATTGPAVTIDVGPLGIAIVSFSFQKADAGGVRPFTMHYAVSGANTIAANLTDCVSIVIAESGFRVHGVNILTGLTPGSTTFTAKYTNQFSATTVNFSNRRLSVISF